MNFNSNRQLRAAKMSKQFSKLKSRTKAKNINVAIFGEGDVKAAKIIARGIEIRRILQI
jgi:hypothetical protein